MEVPDWMIRLAAANDTLNSARFELSKAENAVTLALHAVNEIEKEGRGWHVAMMAKASEVRR